MADITMGHPGPTEATDRGRLYVGWIIPPFFHELPVDTDDPEEAADRLIALVREVMPGGSAEQQLRMFLMYAPIVGELIEAGAAYAGLCLMDMDSRPSTATVAVYRMPLDGVTHAEALAQAEAGLKAAHPDDDIRTSELPYGGGSGVVRIGSAPVRLPAEASPTGEPLEVPRGLIQVFVPLPNDTEMLAFEMSTPCMEDWDYYSELFAEIVRTLDWATEEEAQLAATLSQAPSVVDTAPDEAVVQELYTRSSRVLEALAIRGRMDEAHNQVSATTCPDCWSRGLRSVCAARHRWQIDDVDDTALATAVDRLEARFQADGWTAVARVEGQRVSLTGTEDAPGHRVTAALAPGRRQLVVEVIAPCTRTVLAPGDTMGAFG
jgi:hypothetical protein